LPRRVTTTRMTRAPVDGMSVIFLAATPIRRTPEPGHGQRPRPVSDDEIALGRATARRLGSTSATA
jgi:hypothetical protein